jgi:hypothetical protein
LLSLAASRAEVFFKGRKASDPMKLLSLVEVLVVNVVLIALLLWITGDYGFRAAYWGTEGFRPTTVRYPLFLVTSAVKGSTSIPGSLTVDWQQVVVLVLALTDSVFLSSVLRRRRDSRAPAPQVSE